MNDTGSSGVPKKEMILSDCGDQARQIRTGVSRRKVKCYVRVHLSGWRIVINRYVARNKLPRPLHKAFRTTQTSEGYDMVNEALKYYCWVLIMSF